MKDKKTKDFYIKEVVKNNWSVRQLERKLIHSLARDKTKYNSCERHVY